MKKTYTISNNIWLKSNKSKYVVLNTSLSITNNAFNPYKD